MYTENQYNEFSKRMEERFSKMFEGKYGGFAIGTGWWPIVESLCTNIQNYIDWKEKQGQAITQVKVEQIKEKFGGLRFYYQGGDDEISGMVRMAEAWADVACEECGAAGKRRNGGWIRTLCDKHEAERQARIEEQARKDGLEL
jgi:hypothetical protein